MYSTLEIEKKVNNYLQKQIEFCINGKNIKSGKLILFSIKGFYLTFTLQINNKFVIFELPYPFKLNFSQNIHFNYLTSDLFKNNADVHCRDLLFSFSNKKSHKYLNHEIILREKLK